MTVNPLDTPDFDTPINRRGTLCQKWDGAANYFDVSGPDALPMWVADTDFKAPPVVLEALQALVDHGVFGYTGDDGPYLKAIQWWMGERHGWQVDTDWILTTFGIVNAIGIALDTFTEPGDGILVFAPVYHAFGRIIEASGRRMVEAPLALENGRYVLDLDQAAALLDGVKVVLWCSPHNPGGRVWTAEENAAVAAMAEQHDLLLISDEIHQDLVFDGHVHRPMALTEGIEKRLITLNATSKTFNLAGHHTGNTIIADPALRRAFTSRLRALGLSSNVAGIRAATAAYSPRGAAWLDAQIRYLERNRQTFDKAINAIPGLTSMPLESTYLAWVDFSGTGMSPDEIRARVEKTANIAANRGETFGMGGASFMRFNLGTQHANIEDATRRLTAAFSDLQ
ncbi:MAG: PatB family C-S lyase [Pseudomonadota bacterium]